MKKLLKLITLFSLIFPTISSADIVYCESQCFKMKDEHITTVKGLLYEVAKTQNKETKKYFLPHVAKTIVWVEKIHKDKKTYNLKNFKKDERAELINKAVHLIIDVVSGKTKFNPQSMIGMWARTGARVVAEYEEKIVDKKMTVRYKLELKNEK